MNEDTDRVVGPSTAAARLPAGGRSPWGLVAVAAWLAAASAAAVSASGCASDVAPPGADRLVFSWSSEGYEVLTTPALARDRVVFGVPGAARAVSAADGSEVWTTPLDETPLGTPAVEGDDVWVTTSAGAARLSAPGGALRWQVPVADEPTTAPVLAGDVLVFGTRAGALVALRSADGGEAWRLEVGAPILHPPGTDGTRVVASGLDDRIVCADVATGALLWERVDETRYLIAAPIAAAGLFVLTGYEDTVYAVEASTGDVRWSRYAGNWIVALPIVHEGAVYFGSANGNLFAYDVSTGAPISERTGAVWGFQADLFVYRGEVVVLGNDGRVVGMEVGQGADGAPTWEQSLDFSVVGGAIGAERFFLRSGDDRLVAMDFP